MGNDAIEKDELGRPVAQDGYPTAGLAKIKEAAAACACSIGLIYKMANSGQLEAVRFGRSIRVRWAELREKGLI